MFIHDNAFEYSVCSDRASLLIWVYQIISVSILLLLLQLIIFNFFLGHNPLISSGSSVPWIGSHYYMNNFIIWGQQNQEITQFQCHVLQFLLILILFFYFHLDERGLLLLIAIIMPCINIICFHIHFACEYLALWGECRLLGLRLVWSVSDRCPLCFSSYCSLSLNILHLTYSGHRILFAYSILASWFLPLFVISSIVVLLDSGVCLYCMGRLHCPLSLPPPRKPGPQWGGSSLPM